MRKFVIVLAIGVIIAFAMTGCADDPVRKSAARATDSAVFREEAQATSNAEVQATSETQKLQLAATAEAQKVGATGTAVALYVESEARKIAATRKADEMNAEATRSSWEGNATATQQVIYAKLTAIPANIKTQMETENANKWLLVWALAGAVLLASGAGYYMVRIMETKSSVAYEGPTGITVRRGNTFQAMPRTIGAVTITPPGLGAKARNAILELAGKKLEPLVDTVTQHDRGATATQYAQVAAGDLVASAMIGAAKAQQLNIPKGAAGRDLHITQALPRPTNAPSAQLEAPPQTRLLNGPDGLAWLQAVADGFGVSQKQLVGGEVDGEFAVNSIDGDGDVAQ